MTPTTSAPAEVPGVVPPIPDADGGVLMELMLKVERLEFDLDQRRRTMKMHDSLMEQQTKQLADLQWRLTLSQSFGQLMFKAYTALQAYRIDYRKLPSFKKWDGIDWFEGSSEARYREAISRFITEINHDIDAAIRRKTNIKEVPLK